MDIFLEFYRKNNNLLPIGDIVAIYVNSVNKGNLEVQSVLWPQIYNAIINIEDTHSLTILLTNIDDSSYIYDIIQNNSNSPLLCILYLKILENSHSKYYNDYIYFLESNKEYYKTIILIHYRDIGNVEEYNKLVNEFSKKTLEELALPDSLTIQTNYFYEKTVSIDDENSNLPERTKLFEKIFSMYSKTNNTDKIIKEHSENITDLKYTLQFYKLNRLSYENIVDLCTQYSVILEDDIREILKKFDKLETDDIVVFYLTTKTLIFDTRYLAFTDLEQYICCRSCFIENIESIHEQYLKRRQELKKIFGTTKIIHIVNDIISYSTHSYPYGANLDQLCYSTGITAASTNNSYPHIRYNRLAPELDNFYYLAKFGKLTFKNIKDAIESYPKHTAIISFICLIKINYIDFSDITADDYDFIFNNKIILNLYAQYLIKI